MKKTKPRPRPVFYCEQVIAWVDPALKTEIPALHKADGFNSASDWVRNLIRKARDRIRGVSK